MKGNLQGVPLAFPPVVEQGAFSKQSFGNDNANVNVNFFKNGFGTTCSTDLNKFSESVQMGDFQSNFSFHIFGVNCFILAMILVKMQGVLGPHLENFRKRK